MSLLKSLPLAGIALALVTVAHAGAQQQLPPIRGLGTFDAESAPLPTVASVRVLPNGSVLANLATTREVVLLDSALRRARTIADSGSPGAIRYGTSEAGLLSFRGDSTLFVDPEALSVLVLDPTGRVARTASVPRGSDAFYLVAPNVAYADPTNHVVYRGRLRTRAQRAPDGTMLPPIVPDSAPIIRAELTTRAVDTVAYVKIPTRKSIARPVANGMAFTPIVDPLPIVDEWAVLSDGTIAVLHGREYRVELIQRNGERASARIPFSWERLSDEEKSRLVDSAKTATAAERSDGVSSNVGGAAATTAGSGAPMTFVSPSEVADYRPAFRSGAALPDRDGNLWVRTTHAPSPGGPVYDVIDRTGKLIDRVQLPIGRWLLGFGPGGTAIVARGDERTTILQRARVR